MKCFYHNDLDGRCAASIVENQYDVSDYSKFIEVDYMIDLTPYLANISPREKVYFVDYSFTEKTMWVLEELLKKGCNIVWCDHHKSSMELEKKYPKLKKISGIRSKEYSGAVLTYMYLHDCEYDVIPEYIKYVDDYDCWKYNFGDNTTYFKLGIESIPYDYKDSVWVDLDITENSHFDFGEEVVTIDKIIKKGKIIKDYIDKNNEEYISKYGYESELDGIKCYVVNNKTNSWIFGDRIKKYPFVVVWVYNGEKYSYSIYSEGEVDCSKIAEKFGGGGHAGAAGFSSDKLLFHKK